MILGGGTGGTMAANRLRKRFGDDELEIHVVDRDDRHVYQPGLLFVPFGLAQPEKLVRSRRAQLRGGIAFHEGEVESVSLDADEVRLASGASLPYDVLVVATGAVLQPEETEGLAWAGNVHTFYELERAVALRDALKRFEGGRLVVDIVDMPVSARSRRSSSSSWPTGGCRSAACASAPRSSSRRRSTAASRSRSPPST